MSADSASINLTHHFLIAMPELEDETFAKSIVYLCEHSERGALGLVINKPSDINLQSLLQKVDLDLRRQDLTDTPVFQGGPVQTERGFVLHDAMQADSVALKRFLFQRLYRHPQVMRMTDLAKVIVADLFAVYMAQPGEMRPSFAQRDDRARAVADYIAGMTDRFASAEHERLTGQHLLAEVSA